MQEVTSPRKKKHTRNKYYFLIALSIQVALREEIYVRNFKVK